MKSYNVEGTALVAVSIEVEAENEEEAMEIAYDMQNDLIAFCGNGGTDKLVGTDLDECSLCPMGITYDNVSEF